MTSKHQQIIRYIESLPVGEKNLCAFNCEEHGNE